MQNTFLDASAGSGKTFALCNRYVALLFKGASAKEILTVTFTKKAANEMLQRITRNLKMLNDSKKIILNLESKEIVIEDSKIQKDVIAIVNALKEYGISSDFITKNIDDVYIKFLQSHKKIYTIDSFFNSILRKFSFFAGIRNDYTINESLDNDKVLEHFLDYIKDNNDAFSILLDMFEHEKNTHRFNDNLIQLLDKSIEFSSRDDFKLKLSYEYNIKFASSIIEKYKDEIDADLRDFNFRAKLKEISKSIGQIITDAISFSAHSKDPKAALNLVKTCKDPCKLLKSTLIKNEGRHRDINKIIDIAPTTYQDELTAQCIKLSDFSRLEIIHECALKLQKLYELLESYRANLEFFEMKNNSLSFNSIKLKVFSLMQDTLQKSNQNKNRFDKEYFYFRLDSQFSHILFDEFQDTSSVQYKIFLPLIDEIKSGEGVRKSKSLFIVGDDKQSIYGFRGSNSLVFEEARSRMIQRYLDTNYRSSGIIIDFINKTFSNQKLFNYKDQKIGKEENKEKGRVEIETFDSKTQDIYKSVLKKINALLQEGIAKKDIAVLVNERKIAHALICSNEDKGLTFNIDKSGLLIKSAFVETIICALKAKHSKIYQKRLNILLGRGYYNDEIISFLPSLNTLGKKIKYLIEKYKLFSPDTIDFLQHSLSNANIQDIDSLVELLKDKQSSSFSENAINIMTIHASKGLEFKHIIFLDFKKHGNIPNALLYNYNGLILDNIFFRKEAFSDIEKYKNAKDIEDKAEAKESLNKLYVALSRAEIGLYIFSEIQSYSYNILELESVDSTLLDIENTTKAQGSVKSKANLDSQNTNDLESKNQISPYKTIISDITPKQIHQEEFIKGEAKLAFKPKISTFAKRSKGNSLHLLLELALGYGVKNATHIIKSKYGFYLSEMLEGDAVGNKESKSKDRAIINALQQALNSFMEKNKDILAHAMIKSEVAFLHNSNSLKRIDMIIKNQNTYHLIEFKSAISAAERLEKSHTDQLNEYLNIVKESLSNNENIMSRLIYLETPDVD